MCRILDKRARGGWLRLGLAGLALGVLGAAPSLADQKPSQAKSRQETTVPQVTLNYRRMPLERVLDYISRASRGVNVKIKVDDPAKEEELESMLVTVQLTNVPWRTAVDYIAKKYKFVVNEEEVANGILYLERPPRVTMSVQNAKLTEVVKMIAMGAGQNIIPGPAVGDIENVSFDLQDVPWKEALTSILKTYRLVMVEEESGIIRIVSPESVQATHEVRAVQLKFLQPFGTRYIPQLPQNQYVKTSGEENMTGTSLGSLIEVLSQLKSADGKITYEQRTNTLIIKDTATNIEGMVGIVRQLDREPKQVKIKVRMLTTDDTSSDRKGVRWDNGLIAEVGGGSWQTAFPFSAKRSGRNTTVGGWGDLGPLAPVANTAKGPMPLNKIAEDPTTGTSAHTLGTLSFQQLQATLQYLKECNDAEVIQAPELLALDNQEATIHMGEIYRYAEFYSDDTGSGYEEAPNPVITGVQLIVIPHVCGDEDKVVLEVVPKVEDLNLAEGDNGWRTFGTPETGEIQLPQTQSKIAVTKMMLRSKETGVIAGLLESTYSISSRKIPLLGDIPILGYAFKNKTTTLDKRNMMIFVTPTILGPHHHDDFGEQLEAMRELAANTGMGTMGRAETGAE